MNQEDNIIHAITIYIGNQQLPGLVGAGGLILPLQIVKYRKMELALQGIVMALQYFQNTGLAVILRNQLMDTVCIEVTIGQFTIFYLFQVTLMAE